MAPGSWSSTLSVPSAAACWASPARRSARARARDARARFTSSTGMSPARCRRSAASNTAARQRLGGGEQTDALGREDRLVEGPRDVAEDRSRRLVGAGGRFSQPRVRASHPGRPQSGRLETLRHPHVEVRRPRIASSIADRDVDFRIRREPYGGPAHAAAGLRQGQAGADDLRRLLARRRQDVAERENGLSAGAGRAHRHDARQRKRTTCDTHDFPRMVVKRDRESAVLRHGPRRKQVGGRAERRPGRPTGGRSRAQSSRQRSSGLSTNTRDSTTSKGRAQWQRRHVGGQLPSPSGAAASSETHCSGTTSSMTPLVVAQSNPTSRIIQRRRMPFAVIPPLASGRRRRTRKHGPPPLTPIGAIAAAFPTIVAPVRIVEGVCTPSQSCSAGSLTAPVCPTTLTS